MNNVYICVHVFLVVPQILMSTTTGLLGMAPGAAPGAVFQLRLPNMTKLLLFNLGVAENALREEEREWELQKSSFTWLLPRMCGPRADLPPV
jgi:hypothetical protein